MSGIFGVVGTNYSDNLHEVIREMAEVMAHRDWFEAEQYIDEQRNIAIGRIGIGIFNKGPQPVWNAARTLALVMVGEIYNRDLLEANSNERTDEELILSLYQEMGDKFAASLEGVFNIAIYDQVENKLVIANDRFGLYPLFYACKNRGLLFAPEMKGIFCDNAFPRKLDLTGLAQYIRFQNLLGERTFFEDINFIPAASMLTFDVDSGSCSVKSYWSFDEISYNPNISFEEAVDETGRLLERSVKHLSTGAHRPGVYLSGGLDSRTILGLIEQRPVASITYGVANCRDVHYARRIAKAAGSDHHWIELPDGEWVKEYSDFHLDLTEGYHSWIHSHGMSTLTQGREVMDVNLTGWGAAVMGKRFVEPLLYSAVDDSALRSYLFYKFNQKYTWPSIIEAEEALLYQQPVRDQALGLAYDSFQSELSPYLDFRRDVRSEYFCLRNSDRRLTNNLITYKRSHFEVRFPFYNYDLFDFLYSLPVEYRYNKRLYRAVIQKKTPNLAYIPVDEDQLLPTTRSLIRDSHAFLVKSTQRFNKHIWDVFPYLVPLYADYENYLRNELRDWAEK